MRRLMMVGLLVVGLAAVAHGSIVLDVTEYDLGYVYRDQPQELVYRFRNVSDDSLHIFDIEFSCDCTTAQVVPNPVGPNDTARVLVFFDPMGYEGKGRLHEYLRLMTSDLGDPEVMLTYGVEVGIGPEPTPRALRFGSICRGESDTLLISISPTPGGTLAIFDARSDTACVVVERMEEDTEGEQSFRVIATNMEGCGRVAGLVTFETSDRLRPEMRIPVSVSLAGDIIAEPDIIAFGPTLPGSYVARVVKIYSREGIKFAVPKVVSSIDQLEPEIKPIGDTSCELRLKVKEGARPGQVSGEVRLETDCPDEPPISIEVNGYIRSEKH